MSKVPNVSRQEFMDHAKSIDLVLDTTARVFSTGSVGLHVYGKPKQKVNGKDVDCVLSGNLTLPGSKNLSTEEKAIFVKNMGQQKVTIKVNPKTFSTSSFGWAANGRQPVKLSDTEKDFMVSVNLTVIGSKGFEVAA